MVVEAGDLEAVTEEAAALNAESFLAVALETFAVSEPVAL